MTKIILSAHPSSVEVEVRSLVEIKIPYAL